MLSVPNLKVGMVQSAVLEWSIISIMGERVNALQTAWLSSMKSKLSCEACSAPVNAEVELNHCLECFKDG